MSLKRDDSDQSVSMGRSDEENEAAAAETSFLDEDFLSCPIIETASINATTGNNNNSNNDNTQKHHGNNGNRNSYTNGTASIPWLKDRTQNNNNNNNSFSSSSQRQGGSRGYNSSNSSSYYHEPPPLIQLHNEIVSFVKLMEPTREELDDRDKMVERVTDLAERTFKRVSKGLLFRYVSLFLQLVSQCLLCIIML